jgi:ABC-2 type transport system ATP-binding protein
MMEVTATTPLVEVRGLSKRFGQFLALDSLDLTIGPGVIFGLIGPNGAGKSTTMRILATLLQPSGGEARVAGHSVTRDRQAVRNLIGYMPDEFGVYDNMKIWEYLDFFAAGYGIGRERRPGLIDDLLALVDLGEKRDGYVEALSRGMKQRLCLARALVHDPQLLILDEPASGLDPRARVELRALVRQLGALGKTVIVSSHILTELADMCDEVGIVERGRLLTAGPIDQVLRQVRAHRVLRVRLLPDGRTDAEAVAALVRALPGVLHVTVESPETERGEPAAAVVPAGGPGGTAAVEEGAPGGADSDGEPPSGTLALRVEFEGDDRRRHQFLAELLARGLLVYDFTEERGDLEDAFLRITKGLVA